MSDRGFLSGADIAAWRPRVPAAVLQIGLPATLLVAAVISIVLERGDTSPIRLADVGWDGAVNAAGQGWVFAALLLGWWRPRWAAWLGALGAVTLAVLPTTEGMRPVWVTVALLVVGVILLDAWEVTRQRALATAWGPNRAPELDDATRRELLAPRLGPRLVSGVALVACAVALGIWWYDAAAANEFRARAEVRTGMVVTMTEDGGAAVVEVDGRELRVPVLVLDLEPGQSVAVRVDPTGDRAELVDDVFDPAGAVVPAAAAAGFAGTAILTERSRRRAARVLLTRGGPAASVSMIPDGAAYRLESIDPGSGVALAYVRLGWVGPSGDSSDDGSDDAPPEPSSSSDAEVLAWASHAPWQDAGERLAAASERSDVLVVGLGAVGDRPVLLIDGRWCLAGPPSTDDRTPARLWRSWWVRRTSGRHVAVVVGGDGAGPDDPTAAPDLHPVARHALRLARRTPMWVTILGAGLAFVTTFVLSADLEWIGVIAAASVAGSLGERWSREGRPGLVIRPDGLLVVGAWRDDLAPWQDVLRTVADESMLVVYFGDGCLVLRADDDLAPVILPGERDPRRASVVLEAARGSAEPNVLAVPRRPVSASVWIGAAWFVAALLGYLVA
ncbi:hypothetical protein Bcav_3192 [Beutenbergia cavernae DSM 12333]|uniref:Uncharacterized protein n=1 Tax=Beutenbergia cavernae (strain ATCC BAA-8 / DSM 12333 / CCUG 43141 / JCM 11478 / NBRC 16432 / NCIMB 13614 / HKI 0122) TaxID=471853 RepID=C5C0P0_BEUC1|nr:hypothetical protein [Beutenbergia cavernae]ACQ81436.1 hypothetical protein Bcav_3192 [Beutenbergia cavernae DSM 12333]